MSDAAANAETANAAANAKAAADAAPNAEPAPNANADRAPDGSAASDAPDIDRVDCGAWPRRGFPIDDGRRREAVRIVVRQSVLNDIHRHGQSRTDVEICGVLIGNGYRDEQGPFVYVEGNIRGQHSDSQVAQVTFTGDTWNHIHNELDSKHPELRILGWYHTHPGFGIFLSGMDLFIHENYFNAAEQLALVYDPIGGDEGLFVWRGGRALREGFLVEADEAEDPPVRPQERRDEPQMTAHALETMRGDERGSPAPVNASMPDASDLLARIERIERRQNLGVLALLAVAFLAIAVPVALWFFALAPFLADFGGRAPPSAADGEVPARKSPANAAPKSPIESTPMEPMQENAKEE